MGESSERRRSGLLSVQSVMFLNRADVKKVLGTKEYQKCGFFWDSYASKIIESYLNWVDYPKGHRQLTKYDDCDSTPWIYTLAVSDCGQWLFAGFSDGCICRWDLLVSSLMKSDHQWQAHTAMVITLDISENLMVSGSADTSSNVRLWDLDTFELLRTFEDGHCDYINDVKILRLNHQSHKNNNINNTGDESGTALTNTILLLSLSDDQTMRIWRCSENGRCLYSKTTIDIEECYGGSSSLLKSTVCLYSLMNSIQSDDPIRTSNTYNITEINDNISDILSLKTMTIKMMKEEIEFINDDNTMITMIEMNCDSSLIAILNCHGDLFIYHWPQMTQILQQYSNHNNHKNKQKTKENWSSVCFHPSKSDLIAVTSPKHCCVSILNVRNGEIIEKACEHTLNISDDLSMMGCILWTDQILFTPDGQRMISLFHQRLVSIWEYKVD